MNFFRRYGLVASIVIVAIGVALLTPHQAQYDAANPYAYEEPTHQVSNWDWALTAAISAAIFTGVLALIGMFQTCDTRKSNERQLRAYVSVIASGFDGTRTGKRGGPAFQIAFRNAGQTPANNVRCWTGVKFRDDPLTTDLPPHPNPSLQRTTLGPQCETFGHGAKADPLTPAEVAAMQAGKEAVYFYGCINYDDVFGNPRETNFRLIFRGDRAAQLEKHQDGNHAT
ncbi:MAG: hypothetical protein ACTHPD_01615 [Rhizomicrobium sp.]